MMHHRSSRTCIIIAVLVALFCNLVPVYDAAATLLGRPAWSDLPQDLIGARALLNGSDPYPILGPVAAAFGGNWSAVTSRSTHPPTAFLLVLPVANLSWPLASRVWSLLMIGAFLVSGWAYHWRWYVTVGTLLLWPPVLVSYGQFTPLWLLGLALAWRFRTRPFAAGVAIGFASLPKFFAAAALAPFVRKRNWGAVAGFAVTWALAISMLCVIDGRALTAYLIANRNNAAEQIGRLDNGALLPFSAHIFGPMGVAVVAALIIGIAAAAWRSAMDDERRWLAWTWIGIALLPVAWSYSVLPLLPGLVAGLRADRGIAVRVFSALALASPLIGPLPPRSPRAVALCIALAGIALVYDVFHRHMANALALDSISRTKFGSYAKLPGPSVGVTSRMTFYAPPSQERSLHLTALPSSVPAQKQVSGVRREAADGAQAGT